MISRFFLHILILLHYVIYYTYTDSIYWTICSILYPIVLYKYINQTVNRKHIATIYIVNITFKSIKRLNALDIIRRRMIWQRNTIQFSKCIVMLLLLCIYQLISKINLKWYSLKYIVLRRQSTESKWWPRIMNPGLKSVFY